MVATIDSAAAGFSGVGASSRIGYLPATNRQQLSATPDSAPQGSSTRPFQANDPGYITVEPDGRDDIGFRDRLRQAIETVARAFADREGVTAVVDRIIGEISKTLDEAEAAGEDAAVQIRIASLDVAVSDGADNQAFASIRQFALEVGVARNGEVRAEDTRVLSPDGRGLGLSQEQVRAGLAAGGRYTRTDTGSDDGARSEAASKRLEAAQAGLARVKAVQDALQAFRLGDETPLRDLFEGGSISADDRGSLGQVFPGVGALSFR